MHLVTKTALFALLLLWLAGTTPSQAQLKKIEVTVDLSGGTIAAGAQEEIPFDVRFNLKGTPHTSIRGVQLKYLPSCLGVRDGAILRDPTPTEIWGNTNVALEASTERGCRKRPYYFDTVGNRHKGDVEYQPRSVGWSRSSNASLLMEIGPLHPGIDYSFFFRIRAAVNELLTEPQRKAALDLFREKIETLLRDNQLVFSPTAKADAELQLRKLFTEVAKPLLKRSVGSTLGEDPDYLELELDFSQDAEFALIADTAATIAATANQKLQVVDSSDSISKLLEACQDPSACLRPVLLDAVSKLLPTAPDLADRSEMVLDSVLNPVQLTGLKAFEGAVLVHEALATPSLLLDLLEGKVALEGRSYAPTPDAGAPSAQFFVLLRDILGLLKGPLLVNQAGNPVLDLSTLSDEQLGGFRQLTEIDLPELISALARASSSRSAAENELLAQRLAQRIADSMTTGDVLIRGRAVKASAEDDPYVSWDNGFAGASGVDQAFYFTGASIYMTPVNNDTPIWTTYRGRDRFTKTVGILIGYTESISAGAGDTVQDLTGSGSVVVGASWRLSAVFRLNAGLLVYKAKDPSPLVQDSTETATGFFGASFDLRESLADLWEFFAGK